MCNFACEKTAERHIGIWAIDFGHTPNHGAHMAVFQ